LKSKNESIFPSVVEFVIEQGRMKFVRPLYRELYRVSDNGKEIARKTFLEHRKIYHSIAEKMVAKDLELNSN